MSLNHIVSGAVIAAGTMALPFAVSVARLGLSSTAVLASTVTTKIILACGRAVAEGRYACVVAKSITGAGLAKKALVVFTVVGVATIVGVIAQTASEEDDGEWPLVVYAPGLWRK